MYAKREKLYQVGLLGGVRVYVFIRLQVQRILLFCGRRRGRRERSIMWRYFWRILSFIFSSFVRDETLQERHRI
jgi:hypothetical protein